MKYQQTEYLKYQLLKLTGEVDLHNSPELRTQLLEILQNNSSVIIDFSSLIYIDSSGIATLVEALNFARSNSLSLTIVGATGAPLQVIELTKLNSVFNMVSSLDEIQG